MSKTLPIQLRGSGAIWMAVLLMLSALLPSGCASAPQSREHSGSSVDLSSEAPKPKTPATKPARQDLVKSDPAPPPGSPAAHAPAGAGFTEEQQIEQSLAQLNKGHLAWNTPEKMKVGETAHVTARIGSDKVSLNTLESGMPGDPGARTETAETPVSAKMRMTLKGADFDITSLSSEEQFVGGDTPTTWEWDVVPKHSGELRVHLAATVELNDLARDFKTIDRDVAVAVDPVDAFTSFVQKNWQWLIATLTALGGAIWRYFSTRKKPVAEAAK